MHAITLNPQCKVGANCRMKNEFVQVSPFYMLMEVVHIPKETATTKVQSVFYFLYHIRVIFVCLIFFCNWKMPYMSASDVGGHPGT